MLRKGFFCFILIFSLCFSGSYVAKVNDIEITEEDFNKILQSAMQNLKKQSNIDFGLSEGEFILNTTKRSILNDMINSTLIDQRAREMKIEVKEEDVLTKIANLKKGFPSPKAFLEALFEGGITEDDLKEGLKQQIVVEKIKKELTKKIDISDNEVESFIKANASFLKQPKRIQLFQIVTATEEEAKEVLDLLSQGEDFAELAARYSIDMLSKDSGGNLGFVEEGSLDPILESKAFVMQEGETSEMIVTDEGFHVLKCGQIMPELSENQSLSKSKIKEFLRTEKENIIYEEWFSKVKENAEIIINEDIIPGFYYKEERPDGDDQDPRFVPETHPIGQLSVG